VFGHIVFHPNISQLAYTQTLLDDEFDSLATSRSTAHGDNDIRLFVDCDDRRYHQARHHAGNHARKTKLGK
jgi:hypothetical protein